MNSFAVISTSKNYPKHSYKEMKEFVLGKKYTATLAFVSPQKAQKLNKAYRKKTYIPNVLSFPLTKDTGEIYISLSTAKKEAKNYELTYEGYVGYLFLHGLLHLKGLEHGEKMENIEKRLKKRFNIT